MQYRYCKFQTFKTIPMTASRYTINIDGVVYDTVLKENVTVIKNKSNEDLLTLFDGIKNFQIKRAVLLAIISKCIKIPYELWDKIDVHYVNGDTECFYPYNTVWKYPNGGLKVNNLTDFCYIPGFSRYSIDLNGNVFSHCTNKMLSPYQDKLGYWMYGVTPDIGNRTIVGMHRLLALAHLQYPSNVDALDVNHLDGNKSNNILVNLEWANRKRNCDHAYSTGLRTDNIPVFVRNAFTGEVKKYYSLEECARCNKIDGETVRLRIKNSGKIVYPPGLQFKSVLDNTEWVHYDDPLEEMRINSKGLMIKVTDQKTNEILLFKNSTELSKYLNISVSGMSWRLRNMEKFTIMNGYKIEFYTLANIDESY
jgi:hypothetical protein